MQFNAFLGIIMPMLNGTHELKQRLVDVECLMSEQHGLLEEKDDIIQKKSVVIEAQEKRIKLLEECLRLAKHKRFAPSSEINHQQGDLFNEVEIAADDKQPSAEKARKGKGGRKGLSKHIPREQLYIDLPPEQKAGAIDTFYSLVKEELDIIPAKVRVLEYLQEKAIFKKEGHRIIKTATMPKHPLGKSIASVNLLAYLIVAKYMDALPLYRLERILKRYGGDITRAAMAGWLIRLSMQLQPLIQLMWDHLFHSDYIQADETGIQVLKEAGYSPTGKKYMWVMRGGPPGQPCVLFTYDPSRGHEVPVRLLEDFSGYLQTDGYVGYEAVCRNNGITRVGCWDHARRKFKEAQDANPKRKNAPCEPTLSDRALEKM